MKTPRKILSVCLSFLLIAMITVSGTLAYGNIKRNIDSQGVQLDVSLIKSGDIVDNQSNPDFQILPIREGLSKDEILASEQFVNHRISVENTGTVAAFVRVVLAVPSSLDSENASGNKALHVINGSSDAWVCEKKQSMSIGSQVYNLYSYTYKDKLDPSLKTSEPATLGFYLDSEVTNQNGAYYFGGERLGVDQNGKFTFYTKIQAASPTEFNSAESAFEALGLPSFKSQ